MSIKIMSLIWDNAYQSTDKLVFLALADCANDEGIAWPSIATIARKTGVSERTVQRSIRVGEVSGLIRRTEVKGKGCRYTLTPRHSVTPDKVSPATNETETPDTVSPHPRHSVTQTVIEPSVTVIDDKSSKRSTHFPKPDDVDRDIWEAFCRHRKKKRADISDVVMRAIAKQAGIAGWSLNDALAELVTRNWQTFKADWVTNNGTGNNQNGFGGGPVSHNPMVQAIAAARAERASGEPQFFEPDAGGWT
jgi:Helix-turn-helix domain